jgi:hypothetical protein
MSTLKSAIDDYLADCAFTQALNNPRRSGPLKEFVHEECALLIDGNNQLVCHLKEQIQTMEAKHETQIQMMEQRCQRWEHAYMEAQARAHL